MSDYAFKTCVANARELYEYTEKSLSSNIVSSNSKDFPSSLVSFLDQDIDALSPAFAQLSDLIAQFSRTKEERYLDEAYQLLDEALMSEHPYFKFLRIDLKHRLEQAEEISSDALLEIPARLKELQGQVGDFIAHVLDMDGEKKPLEERLTAYYLAAKETGDEVFQFRPLRTSFELMGREAFAEVLRPETVYELIDYHLRECIKYHTAFRRCKNCGKWFAVTGHRRVEYCGRVFDDKGRTCREIGALNVWVQSKGHDDVFVVYRREYKRRFAWIRSGRITDKEFYAWSQRAQAKKKACSDGAITLAEFKNWLAEA